MATPSRASSAGGFLLFVAVAIAVLDIVAASERRADTLAIVLAIAGAALLLSGSE